MRATPSPVDLEAPPLEAPGLGWTTMILALAALLLLAINARSLADWVDDLPPGAAQVAASQAANGWVALTETGGIGLPRRWLHEVWKHAEAARF